MGSMIYRFRNWFFDTFGKRDLRRTYLGHGNFSEERGWWFRGKFYLYDEEL